MDSYKAFKIEALDIERTWQLCAAFESCEGFRKIYIKKLLKTRLACRVLHKLKTYKKPRFEAIEIIPEELPNNKYY